MIQKTDFKKFGTSLIFTDMGDKFYVEYNLINCKLHVEIKGKTNKELYN